MIPILVKSKEQWTGNDITNAVSIILEKLYKKDNTFTEYVATSGQMGLKLWCSKNTHLIPETSGQKPAF